MATTWTELKAEVADYAHRADLTTPIPTLIGKGETRLARDLLIPPLLSSATVAISAAASSGTMPTGAFAVASVQIASAEKLHYVTPDTIPVALAQAGSVEKPVFFSWRGTTLLISPSWTAGGNLTVQYFKQEDALSGSVSTNWYIANAPEALLYACMIETMSYINAEEIKLKKWASAYEDARDRILEQYGTVDVIARARSMGTSNSGALRPNV